MKGFLMAVAVADPKNELLRKFPTRAQHDAAFERLGALIERIGRDAAFAILDGARDFASFMSASEIALGNRVSLPSVGRRNGKTAPLIEPLNGGNTGSAETPPVVLQAVPAVVDMPASMSPPKRLIFIIPDEAVLRGVVLSILHDSPEATIASVQKALGKKLNCDAIARLIRGEVRHLVVKKVPGAGILYLSYETRTEDIFICSTNNPDAKGVFERKAVAIKQFGQQDVRPPAASVGVDAAPRIASPAVSSPHFSQSPSASAAVVPGPAPGSFPPKSIGSSHNLTAEYLGRLFLQHKGAVDTRREITEVLRKLESAGILEELGSSDNLAYRAIRLRYLGEKSLTLKQVAEIIKAELSAPYSASDVSASENRGFRSIVRIVRSSEKPNPVAGLPKPPATDAHLGFIVQESRVPARTSAVAARVLHVSCALPVPRAASSVRNVPPAGYQRFPVGQGPLHERAAVSLDAEHPNEDIVRRVLDEKLRALLFRIIDVLPQYLGDEKEEAKKKLFLLPKGILTILKSE